MKKLLIAAIILIFSVIPLCAEGQIGISLTPELAWMTNHESNPAERALQTSLTFSIDGANYFPEAYGFGIEYGLGLSLPLGNWYNGSTTFTGYDFSTVGILFRLGPAYRYAFSDFIGISASLGLTAGYFNYLGESATEFNLTMYGKVAADFTFIDMLRVNVGLAMGGGLAVTDYYATNSEKLGIDPDYFKRDISGVYFNRNISAFFLSPFVSVSYLY